MDPVSAIGLVASIVQLIATTSKVIKYVDEVKDAPKERASLASEAANLMPLLMTLKQRAETSSSTDPWFSSVQSLGLPGGPLTELKLLMEQLGGKLKLRKKKLSGHLLWPSDQKECIALLAKIERVKSLIGLAMQDAQFNLSMTMRRDVNKVSNEITTVTEGMAELQIREHLKRDLEILDWLSAQTFGGRQNDIFGRRTIGTGEWLLKTAEFQAFLSPGQRTLWCPGMPGAGKTVLTSYMVDHLKRTYTDAQVGIAFVYCSYKDPDQTPENLIASLLRQFAQRLPSLPEEIRDMYKQHTKEKTRPSLAEYLCLLHMVVQMFSQAFLLVDALDECKEEDGARKSFLAALKGLSAGVHLVVTSRWVPAIESEFSEALKLEIRADSEDVARYVRSRVATTPRLMRHVVADPMLESMISRKIADNCHGMFLMAKLHMDSLTKQPHRKALRLALENLPPELDETYNDALARISSQGKEDIKLAHQVLGWITHATRPLTMKQLQHALSVEPEQTDLDEETLIDEELLISVCLGLVTVDHMSKEIRLVHYTAQKYFEHRLLELMPDNHLRIASTCLTYMSFKTCQEIDELASEKEIKALGDRYPLLDYAGSNWGVHAQRDDQKLVQQILRFLSPRATYLSSRLMIGGIKSLIQESTHKHWDYPVKYEARVSGHNMAAYFGLQQTLMILLSEATDISRLKDMIKSTFLIGLAKGDHTLVQLLIDRGANINTCSWLGYTALRLAAFNKDVASVNMLLNGGADVNALHLNNQWLFNSADPKLCKFRTTVLFDAVSLKLEGIVKLLFDRGADVNLGDATPLCRAVSDSNGRMVSLLIKNGADPRTPGAIGILEQSYKRRLTYPSPEEFSSQSFLGLALMAVANSIEPASVAETLIISGADVNFPLIDDDLKHRLSSSAYHNNRKVHHWLTEWDNSVQPPLDFPLYAASRSGNESLVQLLLNRGAKTWGFDKEFWLQQAIFAKSKVMNPEKGSYPTGGFGWYNIRTIYEKLISSYDFCETFRRKGYSEEWARIFNLSE